MLLCACIMMNYPQTHKQKHSTVSEEIDTTQLLTTEDMPALVILAELANAELLSWSIGWRVHGFRHLLLSKHR